MKRFYYFFIIIFLLSCSDPDQKYYKSGKFHFELDNYTQAKFLFEQIDPTFEYYDSVRIFMKIVDSVFKIEEAKERRINDSIAEVNRIKELNDNIIWHKNELKSIKNFNGNQYRGSIDEIIIEVALFLTWADVAHKGKNHSNKEIQSTSKSIEYNLKQLQLREFPKIRKAYASIVRGKLWVEDIDVNLKGNRYTTLEFVGGIFVTNKNKQEFQNQINQILKDFRFKRVNYKWYEYDDEYTYYTIRSDNDGDLIR